MEYLKRITAEKVRCEFYGKYREVSRKEGNPPDVDIDELRIIYFTLEQMNKCPSVSIRPIVGDFLEKNKRNINFLKSKDGEDYVKVIREMNHRRNSI